MFSNNNIIFIILILILFFLFIEKENFINTKISDNKIKKVITKLSKISKLSKINPVNSLIEDQYDYLMNNYTTIQKNQVLKKLYYRKSITLDVFDQFNIPKSDIDLTLDDTFNYNYLSSREISKIIKELSKIYKLSKMNPLNALTKDQGNLLIKKKYEPYQISQIVTELYNKKLITVDVFDQFNIPQPTKFTETAFEKYNSAEYEETIKMHIAAFTREAPIIISSEEEFYRGKAPMDTTITQQITETVYPQTLETLTYGQKYFINNLGHYKNDVLKKLVEKKYITQDASDKILENKVNRITTELTPATTFLPIISSTPISTQELTPAYSSSKPAYSSSKPAYSSSHTSSYSPLSASTYASSLASLYSSTPSSSLYASTPSSLYAPSYASK